MAENNHDRTCACRYARPESTNQRHSGCCHDDGAGLLTQALGHLAAPGAIAHAGEDGGEGELVARRAAVAHAGAPLEVGALQDAVRDGKGGHAGDS